MLTEAQADALRLVLRDMIITADPPDELLTVCFQLVELVTEKPTIAQLRETLETAMSAYLIAHGWSRARAQQSAKEQSVKAYGALITPRESPASAEPAFQPVTAPVFANLRGEPGMTPLVLCRRFNHCSACHVDVFGCRCDSSGRNPNDGCFRCAPKRFTRPACPPIPRGRTHF